LTAGYTNPGTYWIQTIANTVVLDLDEFPLMVTDQENLDAIRPAEEISETIN
jgi:hypothetical protein